MAIIFFVALILVGIALFVGLTLGNVFSKKKQVAQTTKQCDFEKCNTVLTEWVKKQKGDIDNSAKEFVECHNCPERYYSQITSEVKKYNKWIKLPNIDEIVKAIVV